MGGRGHWEGTFLIGGGPPVEPPLLELSAKLHYTDTDYGHVVQHHQRTSSQQFYNLLYDKSPPTDNNLPHPFPNILTCRDVGLWHCDVANLLYNKL